MTEGRKYFTTLSTYIAGILKGDEFKVFYILLGHTQSNFKTSKSAIAKIANINRDTVYKVTDRLKQLNLIDDSLKVNMDTYYTIWEKLDAFSTFEERLKWCEDYRKEHISKTASYKLAGAPKKSAVEQLPTRSEKIAPERNGTQNKPIQREGRDYLKEEQDDIQRWAREYDFSKEKKKKTTTISNNREYDQFMRQCELYGIDGDAVIIKPTRKKSSNVYYG